MNSGVLFVSPYPRDARTLAQMLDGSALLIVHANCLKDASNKLETGSFQVIVSEADLEDGNWMDALRLARRSGAELVVTHPWADASFWAEAMNLGTYDLLAQPFQRTEVCRVLASAAGASTAFSDVISWAKQVERTVNSRARAYAESS
jgi:DNA-binding NtrC family response regulator